MSDGVDLKQLAAEREARRRSGAAAATDAPAPPPPRRPAPTSAPRPAARAGGSSGGALAKCHRSVRMAHSLGLALVMAAGVLLILLGLSTTWLFVALAGVALGRGGAGVVHSILPETLREGGAPTDAEVAASPSAGAFGRQALSDPGAALAEEWAVLLENLAFACTYGKRNCLTNQMYTGEHSLGKICSLVGGKLSEGVLRCA